jgi:hypothetical protein
MHFWIGLTREALFNTGTSLPRLGDGGCCCCGARTPRARHAGGDGAAWLRAGEPMAFQNGRCCGYGWLAGTPLTLAQSITVVKPHRNTQKWSISAPFRSMPGRRRSPTMAADGHVYGNCGVSVHMPVFFAGTPGGLIHLCTLPDLPWGPETRYSRCAAGAGARGSQRTAVRSHHSNPGGEYGKQTSEYPSNVWR